MADNFGLKIGLEGEKEFKKSISEINQTFKVLGSEMKLVTAQFDKNDNSIEALTARQQVLGKEVDAQRQKVETLRAALANSTESFGENEVAQVFQAGFIMGDKVIRYAIVQVAN